MRDVSVFSNTQHWIGYTWIATLADDYQFRNMALDQIQFEKIDCETDEFTDRKQNKCVIELENNAAKVYYSGQLICGTVQLSLNEKKDVRGVALKIVGKAYVRWTEGYGQHRTTYKCKELFLDKQTYLIGGRDGCVTTEPLEIVAQIPECGYILRQNIDLHLQVNNKSNQPVLEFTIQLIQKIKYFTHAKSPTKKTDEIVLQQEYVEGCDAGKERDFNVDIIVPTVPPNQNEISNIIKIKYFIRTLVSVPCCHTDPELRLPIIIGSNPMEDVPSLPPWINPFANDFK